MAELTVAAGTTRGSPAGLPERLRAETAQLHARVEEVVDVAGRVRTRADYIGLLSALAGLHAGLEGQLVASNWDWAWAGVGVHIADHCRAGQLVTDLDELGAPAAGSAQIAAFPTFGHALGCLYVLEGSALGGRIVARMVNAAIGDVPTSFFSGHGRGHLWLMVREALRRYTKLGGDGDAVVTGAVATFSAFASGLAQPAMQK
ncbi:MAG: biliverdin-producing heme oxygenase [Nakamurella sp.]